MVSLCQDTLTFSHSWIGKAVLEPRVIRPACGGGVLGSRGFKAGGLTMGERNGGEQQEKDRAQLRKRRLQTGGVCRDG